jgi:3-phosphoshikimate 1-carboxyvinyltransferase
MDVRITASSLAGTATAPPSKSYTHRAILAAGYADGALVADPLVSADTRATMRAVAAFGGAVEDVDGGLLVEGFSGEPTVPEDVIDCANSGTTMRLATAAAALVDGTTVLTGDESLRSRPQGPLLDAIEALEGRAESTRGNGQAPLVVGGPIPGGRVSIPGDVSSQFVTALLMAGGLTDEGIRVDLETELKSAPYVEITREVLSAFGVETDRTDRGFAVPGGQRYDPTAGERERTDDEGVASRDAPDVGVYRVPGDFSSISYLLAAGAIAAPDGVAVENARPGAQGEGLGRTLLRRALYVLADEDASVVKLEVRESNHRAQALYADEGFDPARRVPRYYGDGEAAFVMVLDVDEWTRAGTADPT